jgi:hypothetical protein
MRYSGIQYPKYATIAARKRDRAVTFNRYVNSKRHALQGDMNADLFEIRKRALGRRRRGTVAALREIHERP